jgi:hypothetical protein
VAKPRKAGGSSGGAKSPRSPRSPRRYVDGLYTVERLIDRRWANTRWQYLVRWEGFDASHDTWEDERNIIDPALLEEFHASLPTADAPSPLAEMPLTTVVP